jgi:collagenase-like PrtC family protease
MVQIYRQARDLASAGELHREVAEEFRNQARALSYGGITAGHFLRGLKE